MPYNIVAECQIGRIMSRRVQPQRAVRQAREYRRRGYTDIRILDVDSGEVFSIQALAAMLQPPKEK